MNIRFVLLTVLLLLLCSFCLVSAQEEVTIVAPTSEAADDLDLKAVCELFKDSENLEEFEKSLNDPEMGINNLDLDENGEVDFVRVVEEVAEDTHVIILQVPMAEDEFQDVATIEVEKTEDDYNMQVHGNEVIYGADYYVAPAYVRINTWPMFTWMYRPAYRPYRSVFFYRHYPPWYRPYRPVTVNVYRTRTVKLTNRTTFNVTRTSRVRSVTKVNYHPRSSTLVKKKTTVIHTPGGGKGVKKSTSIKTQKGKATTVKKGAKTPAGKKAGKKAAVKKKKRP